MQSPHREILVGDTALHGNAGAVEGDYSTIRGERYYRIRRYDQMPPFFMSVVSSADHWMFISSTGGLTAGRVNPESALFPYLTDDKIADDSEHTGSKAIVLVERGGRVHLWEPLSARYAGLYRVERNLYKNAAGDKLMFEEINHDLGLTYRVAWRTSDRFGFVRTTWLRNDSAEPASLSLIDGVQNVLPHGVTSATQASLSNLLNAYKRSELDPATGLGVVALSAQLSDRAEPSESLKATAAFQLGLDGACCLLSSAQLDRFRRGEPVVQETDVKGRRGAYLLHATMELGGGEERTWSIVLDVNLDHARLVSLRNRLKGDRVALGAELERDIEDGTRALLSLVAGADGLQCSADELATSHHYANVLFNIMRGGVFAAGTAIDKADLLDFVKVRSRAVLAEHERSLATLPEGLGIRALEERAAASGSPDLLRICREYLPLMFSRRHGDPSRPWNLFSINLKKEDGTRRFDYQGNWRDIFQNWEPLACAFPDFTEGMIARFLNATTVDGYNPYRVTRDGIEWETPEPENPWSNIGYWSDHQIIYLQKLMEVSARFHPGALEGLLAQRAFSHADVPYRIRPYAAILEDWYNTIDFDQDAERAIEARVRAQGTDGRLVHDGAGRVLRVSMAEKLLVLLLAKLVNLVPDGGVWMNTQRPEWNDANNALVGKGLSVVTVAYLRRFIIFCRGLFGVEKAARLEMSEEVKAFQGATRAVLERYRPTLAKGFDDKERRAFMDAMGEAGSEYRARCYRAGFSGAFAEVLADDIAGLLDAALAYVDQILTSSRRSDGLYHSYNILRLGDGSASVSPLYEMLEGQVAVLSSGLLSGAESLALLQSLRRSHLYRPDQHSYILYPNRDLPHFLLKNTISPAEVLGLSLVARLAERGDRTLLARDEDGNYHFSGSFRNARDVEAALRALERDPALADLVSSEGPAVLQLFEKAFDHSSFTGRSGTFFAYEGLGSIYWHMVSKLLLAAQESFWRARAEGAEAATLVGLAEAYYDIRAGIGFNKTPAVYGAFPTDPYSHTPAGQGAKQPGMTGQVKEEILTRLGELGVVVEGGVVSFCPALLRAEELIESPTSFHCVGKDGRERSLALPPRSLAFTFCQTPVVLVEAPSERVEVAFSDGSRRVVEGSRLPADVSQRLFERDPSLDHLTVYTRVLQIAR
jgi:hypothetical protein